MSARCQSCGAAVRWEITARGARIPLDEEPDPNGNMMLVGDGVIEPKRAIVATPLLNPDKPRFMPHHATCPDGRKWRRR